MRGQPAILEPVLRFHPLKAGLLFLFAAAISLSIPFTGNASLYVLAVMMLLCAVLPMWYSWQGERFDAFDGVGPYFLV